MAIYKTKVYPNAEILKNLKKNKIELNYQIASIASNAKELYSRTELPRSEIEVEPTPRPDSFHDYCCLPALFHIRLSLLSLFFFSLSSSEVYEESLFSMCCLSRIQDFYHYLLAFHWWIQCWRHSLIVGIF